MIFSCIESVTLQAQVFPHCGLQGMTCDKFVVVQRVLVGTHGIGCLRGHRAFKDKCTETKAGRWSHVLASIPCIGKRRRRADCWTVICIYKCRRTVTMCVVSRFFSDRAVGSASGEPRSRGIWKCRASVAEGSCTDCFFSSFIRCIIFSFVKQKN